MEPARFEYGSQVRVIRNVRNDGTFPGTNTGELLIRRGSTGVVRDIGTFLQDQVIYTVHFIDEDRLVGCRDKELIAIDAPWTPSRFEFSDKVLARIPLGINGEIVANPGDEGEIFKVMRDADTVAKNGGIAYHVRFPGRTLMVPETALEEATPVEPVSEDVEPL